MNLFPGPQRALLVLLSKVDPKTRDRIVKHNGENARALWRRKLIYRDVDGDLYVSDPGALVVQLLQELDGGSS